MPDPSTITPSVPVDPLTPASGGDYRLEYALPRGKYATSDHRPLNIRFIVEWSIWFAVAAIAIVVIVSALTPKPAQATRVPRAIVPAQADDESDSDDADDSSPNDSSKGRPEIAAASHDADTGDSDVSPLPSPRGPRIIPFHRAAMNDPVSVADANDDTEDSLPPAHPARPPQANGPQIYILIPGPGRGQDRFQPPPGARPPRRPHHGEEQ